MNEISIHKDSVDLLVTAVIIAGLHGDREHTTPASRAAVANADAMGQVLLDAIAAGSTGTAEAAPTGARASYSWCPVADLMGLQLAPEQLLQVEQTRRHVLEATRDVAGLVPPSAFRMLQVLGDAVSHGLEGFPRDAGGDYIGLAALPPVWRRRDELAPSTSPRARS